MLQNVCVNVMVQRRHDMPLQAGLDDAFQRHLVILVVYSGGYVQNVCRLVLLLVL